jgi:glutamate synthase (NADPH/NADH) small chain
MLSELRREFNAVFLGFGLADAMPLDVPGAELRGVYQSFPYVSQNALPAGQPAVDVRGKRVAVLGGGDTAMDVLRIAIRRGAAAALCIYRRDEARRKARSLCS